MAAPVAKTTSIQSQASKKKKGKGERRTESPAPSATGSAVAPTKPISLNPSESQEYEHPYLKELAKNVRNCNKKLAAVSKTESVVVAHSDKTLDDLVAAKIINADQRAQVLNKPTLLAKLAEAEEQLNQYKKIHTEYQDQRATDRKQLEETLAEQKKKEVEEAVAEAEARAGKKMHDSLLSISQFLAVAAARRGDDFDPEEDENRALEGCLLQVYHGNEAGVEAMLKISGGSTEKTTSVNGDTLETSYAQVKEIAATYAAAIYAPTTEALAATEEQPVHQEVNPTPEAADVTKAQAPIEIVPILVDASLANNTADNDATLADTNGHTEETASATPNGVPTNAPIAGDAANAATESQWSSPTQGPTMSQSWVSVPRDPVETETSVEVIPAAPANTQSWSDEVADHHDATPETSQPVVSQEPTNDGFTAVQRRNPRESRGESFRGRGRGGRGRGDGFRGRGPRGEHRGRGRRTDAPSS